MKQTNGVIWVVEILGGDGNYGPMLNKVTESRRSAKALKERTQAGFPADDKFRVAKYVREGEGQ